MRIEGLLAFLLSTQQPNGSFFTFVNSKESTAAIPINTTFATSLILICLYHVKDQPLAATIIRQGVDFLLQEKSKDWSWNYWQEKSPKRKLQSYPDDWDDTACALTALSLYRAELITPEALASITKLLIATEVKPGGPYYTWMLQDQSSLSKDIDVVVNANINYFLNLHTIHLNSLASYLNNHIDSENYTSLYYHQPEVITYFLARSCSQTERLSNSLLKKRNKEGLWENDLLTAMSVSTLLRCNSNPKKFSAAITHLEKISETNNWKSFPLYIEQSKNETMYAGSPALTAAFVLEALSLVQKKPQEQSLTILETETEILHHKIVNSVKERLLIFSEKENSSIKEFIDRLLSNDRKNQITLLPYYFSRSLPSDKTVSENLIFELGKANLYGWIAYTIYDNILDNADDIKLLPIANICLREVTSIYKTILSKEDYTLFKKIMDRMEQANSWEYTHCHIQGREIISKKNLIHYPENLLSDKSLPHALGPIAILLPHHHTSNSQAVALLLSFFSNYLKARQLNDDAHDWQKDIESGFLNSVTLSLFENYFASHEASSHIDLQADLSLLQSHFWHTHIQIVTQDIDSYIKKAQHSLAELKNKNIISSSEYLESLLEPLSTATHLVYKETTLVNSFISAFRS